MVEEMSSRPLHDSALEAKIMIRVAIVIFLVLIFVLVLHLHAKWFWGRSESSPASAQQNFNGRRRLHSRSSHLGRNLAGKGLDPLILQSLPAVIFSRGASEDGVECAICLLELTEGEKARFLPKCNHGFHSDCIDMWFESHSTCPICRNTVGGVASSKSAETDVEDSSSTGSSIGELAPLESPNFPTNVLFWGNEFQISSGSAACLEEVPSSSASPSSVSAAAGTSSSSTTCADGVHVIDVPRPIDNSSSRFAEEEPPKSPITTRLRSQKRLLSRERRINPCSSSSADAGQSLRPRLVPNCYCSLLVENEFLHQRVSGTVRSYVCDFRVSMRAIGP